jgi:hypothetical protein
MKYPKYQYRSETSMTHYEFTSEGPKGLIKKIVEFTETGTENDLTLDLLIMMRIQKLQVIFQLQIMEIV